jgi:hypothetical protein
MNTRSAIWFLAIAIVSFCARPGAQSGTPSSVPDLSGDWQHPVVVNLSRDKPPVIRGKESDIPYTPESLAKTMAEVSTTGNDGRFEQNTDPYVHYCEPLGLVRMFGYPGKSRFIQTPEAVYILDEIGPTYRIAWLNSRHPDDPDPQYLGHSIGWYENGDTLVVDTVGVNDKTWLDQAGHPHSDQMHLVERFKRVSDTTLEYQFILDDPGAYTRPWGITRSFTRSTTGFLRYQWVCSVRDAREHYEKVGKAGNDGVTTFK